MRHALAARAICAVVACDAAGGTLAAGYPAKPIRLIVGTAPSGGTDTLARAIGYKLTENLGQQVVIDNRPGAGGVVGADLVSKSTPDGHTLLVCGSAYAGTASLLAKLPFDPVKDFSAVILLGATSNLLVVHPAVPAKSVQELIVLARARPAQLNYASGGVGSTLHLAAELFKEMTSTKLVHIPYKGGVPAVSAVLSGEAQIVFGSVTTTLPMIRQGRLRAIAVTSAQRSMLLPELPTVAEAGVPGYEATNWYGLLAPARTPRSIVVKLNAELTHIMKSPDFRERMLSGQGIEPIGGTPEQFAAYLRQEIAKWTRVVRNAGIRAD